MGIFGTTQPKFVYLHGSGGSEVTVDLANSMILTSEPATDYVEQKSAISGTRAFLNRGTHWRVEIQVNLWKYTSPTPAQKYTTICTYKGQKVSLWLHSDGNPFYKSAGVDALFVLKEVIPRWSTTTDWKDYLVLVFETADPIYQA